MVDVITLVSALFLALFVPVASVVTAWFWTRRDRQPIKARSPQQLVFGNIVFIIFGVTLCMQRIFWKSYPCLLNMWQGYIGLIAIGNIYSVRAWMLYCAFTLTQRQLDVADVSSADAVKAIRKLVSKEYLIIRVLCVSIPLFVAPVYITFTVPGLVGGKGNCGRDISDYFLSAYCTGYILVFLWFGLKLADVFDGFGIKSELKSVGLVGLVALPTWLVFNNAGTLKEFNMKVFPVSTMTLLIAISFAVYRGTVWPLVRSYQLQCGTVIIPEIVRTDKQLTSPTEEPEGLQFVLSTLSGQNKFRAFCASEFAAENFLFWLAVNGYKESILTEENVAVSESSVSRPFVSISRMTMRLSLASTSGKPSTVKAPQLAGIGFPVIPLSATALPSNLPPLTEGRIRDLKSKAKMIFEKFILPDCPLEVNLSSLVLKPLIANAIETGVLMEHELELSAKRVSVFPRRGIKVVMDSAGISQQNATIHFSSSLKDIDVKPVPCPEQHSSLLYTLFDRSQFEIFRLMENDTYGRFKLSPQYRDLVREHNKAKDQQQVFKEFNVL